MKVTQITTVYNVEEWLERTIQSFLSQTLKDSELILVNDCSPDGSLDIINRYLDNPRITLINNETNLGPGVSRQKGIDKASGEYTIFVDGDDWLEADCFEVMYKAALENNADIVSCKTFQHNDYGINKKQSVTDVIIRQDKHNFINNKLIKKVLWEKTFYSPLRYREDINTLFRCLEYGNCVYLDYAGYHYNLRPSSLTSTPDVCKNCIYYALSLIENIKYAEDNFKSVSTLYSFIFNKKTVQVMYYLAKKHRKGEEYKEEFLEVENYLKTF